MRSRTDGAAGPDDDARAARRHAEIETEPPRRIGLGATVFRGHAHVPHVRGATRFAYLSSATFKTNPTVRGSDSSTGTEG